MFDHFISTIQVFRTLHSSSRDVQHSEAILCFPHFGTTSLHFGNKTSKIKNHRWYLILGIKNPTGKIVRINSECLFQPILGKTLGIPNIFHMKMWRLFAKFQIPFWKRSCCCCFSDSDWRHIFIWRLFRNPNVSRNSFQRIPYFGTHSDLFRTFCQ